MSNIWKLTYSLLVMVFVSNLTACKPMKAVDNNLTSRQSENAPSEPSSCPSLRCSPIPVGCTYSGHVMDLSGCAVACGTITCPTTDAPAVGSLESADNARVTGWARDPDIPTPVYVHIYVDNTFAAQVPASQAHATAGGNFGFTWEHAPFTSGQHTVTAYAIGVNSTGNNSGANPQLGNSIVVSVASPVAKFLPPLPSGTLKYFGYWNNALGDYYNVDDELNDQQAYSNVTMTVGLYWDPASQSIIDHLNRWQSVRARPMRVVLAWPFWNGSPGAVNQTQFNAWVDVVRPYIDQVVAFGVADEPDCNYNGATFPNGWTAENCLAQKQLLEAHIALLKTAFPNTPAWVNYTSAFVHGLALPINQGYDLPANADWVSFDCYTQWDRCFTSTVAVSIQELKNRMRSHQRIVMIPRGFQGEFGGYVPTEAQIAQEAEQYYQLASADPMIVGIFPFIWWSFSPAPNVSWIGARDSAVVRAKYAEIGRRITVQQGQNCSVGFSGTHNTPGLPNGDARFICFNSRWYDCGWNLNDNAWETKTGEGQQIGGYRCNLSNARWDLVP